MKNKVVLYIKAFLPTILWAGLIFFLSAQQVLPSLSISILDLIFKKTAHIFVYAVLYYLLIRGYQQIGYNFKKIWLQALILCLLYAISDELHQATVSGRTSSAIDVGFDLFGASLVVLYKFDYLLSKNWEKQHYPTIS